MQRPDHGRRDRTRRLLLALPLLGLAACGTTPPLRWHRLPLEAATAPSSTPAPLADTRWELVREVVLPEYLQRETMFVSTGGGRLQALPQDRWAEPLQDAVPRLLLHDLALLRGAERVWPAPAPPDVQVQQRLRVQLLALEAEPARGRLVLQARCTWQPLHGGGASRVQTIAVQVPLADTTAASLVQAHRAALHELAMRIAAG